MHNGQSNFMEWRTCLVSFVLIMICLEWWLLLQSVLLILHECVWLLPFFSCQIHWVVLVECVLSFLWRNSTLQSLLLMKRNFTFGPPFFVLFFLWPDLSCGNTRTIPVNSRILWKRSIWCEGPHSFFPAQGTIERSRTGLFLLQITRCNNQVT